VTQGGGGSYDELLDSHRVESPGAGSSGLTDDDDDETLLLQQDSSLAKRKYDFYFHFRIHLRVSLFPCFKWQLVPVLCMFLVLGIFCISASVLYMFVSVLYLCM